jgi:shikimate kinase
VGRLLAERLQVPFHDTDRAVEAATGSAIADYFRREGEAAFRDRESEVLKSLCQARPEKRPMVVAAGGGIVLREENVGAMRAAGMLVWLSASPATIRSRMEADPGSALSRPPLAGRSALLEVEEVLRAREPLYRSAADVEISTEGRAPAEIAGSVLEWLARLGPQAGSGR